MRRPFDTLLSLTLSALLLFGGHFAVAAPPHGSYHGGGVSHSTVNRSTTVNRNTTVNRSTSVNRGAYGGTVGHTTVNRGVYGGTTVGHTTVNRGVYGGATVGHTTVNRGVYGGTVGHTTVNRSPYGHTTVNRTVVGSSGFNRGVAHRQVYVSGRRYVRPGWGTRQVNVYQRNFFRYPGFRSYGLFYGLAPGLIAFPALAFLSAGLLVGSYLQGSNTVYVYVVEEDGLRKEYRVDDQGNVLSTRIVP